MSCPANGLHRIHGWFDAVQKERLRGKSNTLDAEHTAARSALNDTSTAVPKTNDGAVEKIRQIKVANNAHQPADATTARRVVDALGIGARHRRRDARRRRKLRLQP